ncbi:MAG: molybdenum cofactor guanylyltransferase MobA [Gammaproteobacteria bacterium]
MMENIVINRCIFTGIILAGGEASRMGGQDKGLIPLNGRPLIEYVLEVFTPQVGQIIINANRNQSAYACYGHPVIKDEFDGYCGPLAGMASCLRSMTTPVMVTAPCDSPFVPGDLVARLYHRLEQENAEISVVHNGVRLQPVFTMMRNTVLDSLLSFLNGGERKIDKWFELHKVAVADFSGQPDMFLNINTRDELEMVEARLREAAL